MGIKTQKGFDSLRPETVWQRLARHRVPYLFLMPALALMGVFYFFPLMSAVRLSFMRWDSVLPPLFVGFDNYIEVLSDQSFWQALLNNLVFVFVTTSFSVGLGLLFAAAIQRRLHGWRLYRLVYFLPRMLPMTVVGILFTLVLEPTTGLLNSILRGIGLGGLTQAWLGDTGLALYCIIAVAVWFGTGFCMVVLLTAAEGIPREVHEAATLDGVNEVQRFTRITFPMIKRVVGMLVMLQIIFSFKVFDLIWVMTEGGPGEASTVLGVFVYKSAFSAQRFGYAAAVAIVMTLIIGGISLVYLKYSKLANREIE